MMIQAVLGNPNHPEYCFATSSEPCRPSMSFRCSPQAVPAA